MVEQEHVPMCPVFLTGLMAAGKTTVASLLASHWQVPWLDLDRRIEGMTGMTITEIIAQQGESEFRRIEEHVLFSLLQEPGVKERTLVIATGGGVVMQQKNRMCMKDVGLVIYLQASPQVLALRCQQAGEIDRRPLLTNSPKPLSQRFEELLQERRVAYEDADLVVDADQLPEACVQQIVAKLSSSSLIRHRRNI